ncbi:MAG TPA: hypothetical protein DDW76_38060 [Cyanobacteria bacterium UBA11369]|nr:hypothetical protein [Cyanobacteria bacterium UBA11371]HBE35883.1 hypothetical protein [Cyanobacteria bacterium UBA11368]HBE54402.1 hypothetical protein [Cyanobacteria bacterium UBA11369]
MNKAPVLSCCLTYGFETSDSFSIARLLERMLRVNFDMSDRPDMGGKVYEFKSWTANVGELESVLLCPNYVDGFGWKEPAFKNCLLLSEIFWQTTNLLDLGQLAADVEVDNDPRIHLIYYEVIGDMFGDGIIHQLRREFPPNERELRWDSHFKDFKAEDEEDDFDDEETSKPEE